MKDVQDDLTRDRKLLGQLVHGHFAFRHNRSGHGNEFHSHPGSFWSGVYYVDDGGIAADPSLGGELDGAGSLRGVGRLEARQARMAELPMALRLLQATQLMLPLADSLDTAEAGFNIRDRTLRFERLDLTCPTLKLIGSGSLDLSSWEVALRFRNRGTVPLPLECPPDVPGGACDASGVLSLTTAASLQHRPSRRDHANRPVVLARFRGVHIAAGRRARLGPRFLDEHFLSPRATGRAREGFSAHEIRPFSIGV